MNLREASDTELMEELARRTSALQHSPPPAPLAVRDYRPLETVCQAYVKLVAENKSAKDYEEYIYESAMQCVYGEEIWHWMRSVLRQV